jgi:hypothetical protein
MKTDELKKLVETATPGPWTGHKMIHQDHGGPMTPEEIGEYVCNSVKLGDPSRFLFVSGKHADGRSCDVCHTGNGPRGPYNTALIAAAPDLAREVIALREAAWKAAETYKDAEKALEAWADCFPYDDDEGERAAQDAERALDQTKEAHAAALATLRTVLGESE